MLNIIFVRNVDEKKEGIFYVFLVDKNLRLISPLNMKVVANLLNNESSNVSYFNEDSSFEDGIKIYPEKIDCAPIRIKRKKLELQDSVCPILK